MPRRLKVTDINPHVICTLCDGYLVDATAIIECLHAFCRTCIVEYLQNSKFCPVCDVQVHKTRPLLSIRSDQTLQDLVYKMVPGLYQNEMKRRRDFYRQHRETRVSAEPELRGEGEPRFFSPKESISLSLHHRPKDCKLAEISQDKDPTTRHLSCPAAFTVGHLKKFIHSKFSLPSTYTVDIFYEDQLLRESYSLMDVAYIYSWKRAEPMKFFYNISKCIPKIVEPVPAIPPPTTKEMDIDSTKCDTVVSDNVLEVQTFSKEEIETMQVDELPRPENNEKIDQNVPACPSPMALPPSPPLSEKELAVSPKENIPPSSDDVQPMDTTESEVTHSSLPEKLPDLSSLSEPSCDIITPSSVPEISSESIKTLDSAKESSKTTDILSLVAEQCNSVISSSTVTKPASNSIISQPSVPITTCNSILISSSVPQIPYNSIAIPTPIPEPSYNSVAITSPVSEPTYNSVKLVSTPEGDTVLSPTNGFKLKFIHDPELIPKSRSKKSGRKARSSRHKNVPVRLARLAPYPPPPPPPVPVTCLTTQSLQHLPQFTVGKLVPSVITTLAPTFVTTLVSTTSNSLCNVRNNSSASQVPSFLDQQSTISNNVLSHSNGILPPFSRSSTENDILTSSKITMSAAAISSTVTTDLTSTPAHQDSQIPIDTKELSCTEMASENNIVIPSSISLTPVTINENSVIASESPMINTVSVSFSSSDTKVSTAFVNSFDSSAKITPSSVTQTDNQSLKTTSLFASLKDANPSEIVASMSANVTVPVNSDLADGAKPDSKFSSSFIKEQSPTFESMTNGEENHIQTLKNKDLKTVDHNSESFMRSVKNSISAEFSDNDDLGCPPDLVVDEQKMDSSDNEDDTDVALRKKINAIAEKEDETDVTDDTEADSGRASDMSCPARCEEDIGSPATTETLTSLSITTSIGPPSSVDNRHTKSNNIDHVIKQLYLHHEIGHPSSPKPSAILKPPVSSVTSKSLASPAISKSPASPATLKPPASPVTLKPPASPVTLKPPASPAVQKPHGSPAPPKDDSGVLDLSTCTRKSGEIQSTRPKPVANPVMDIKHRKQPYLPAPIKQHTVCPPAPKHPTSSLLMHQLTTVRHSTPSILQAQLTGNTKSYANHPQNISFVNPAVSFALQGNRNVSSPSPLPVRPSQSTYNYSFPQYSGMLPYPIMDMASYAARSSMVSNLPPRSSSSSLTKEITSSPSSSCGSKTPSFMSHSKLNASTSRRLANTFISSAPPPIGHCRAPTVPSPSSAPAHPRTSPSVMTRMSPHHRSASPAPSPQNVSHSFTMSSLTPTTTASTTTTTTTSSQCKPSVPMYKKSESSHKGFKLKKNANLTVFNPDPNGFSKLVIKNLDSRSNNHHK